MGKAPVVYNPRESDRAEEVFVESRSYLNFTLPGLSKGDLTLGVYNVLRSTTTISFRNLMARANGDQSLDSLMDAIKLNSLAV